MCFWRKISRSPWRSMALHAATSGARGARWWTGFSGNIYRKRDHHPSNIGQNTCQFSHHPILCPMVGGENSLFFCPIQHIPHIVINIVSEWFSMGFWKIFHQPNDGLVVFPVICRGEDLCDEARRHCGTRDGFWSEWWIQIIRTTNIVGRGLSGIWTILNTSCAIFKCLVFSPEYDLNSTS